MKLFILHHPLNAGFGIFPLFVSPANTIRQYCLAGMIVFLGAALLSGRSEGALPAIAPRPVSPALAGIVPHLQSQVMVAGRHLAFNVDGFNIQRKRDIARQTRKLLSLAMALKTELEQSPGSSPSPGEMKKVRQIEKLARKVKQTMSMSPVGGPV